MALKDEIKAIIKRQGWTLTDVANEMTKVTGKKYYCAYLSRRINNETINYKEMKILFAKGNSQYGSLRENADEIINYLQKQGHNIVVIDRKIEGVWENVPNVLDDTFDMVLSLQVLAYKIKVLMDASGKQIKGLKYISIRISLHLF